MLIYDNSCNIPWSGTWLWWYYFFFGCEVTGVDELAEYQEAVDPLRLLLLLPLIDSYPLRPLQLQEQEHIKLPHLLHISDIPALPLELCLYCQGIMNVDPF